MVGGVQADAISSDTVMRTQAAQYNKQQLIDMVSRADVQSKLIALAKKYNVTVTPSAEKKLAARGFTYLNNA